MTKHTVMLGLGLASLMAAFSAPAFGQGGAVVCTNCATTGDAQSILQQLARIDSSIQTGTQTLRTAQDRAASAIVSELNAQLAGQGELIDGLASSFRETLRQHQAAMAADTAQRNYGYGSEEYELDGVVHRPTAQPLTLCGSSARAETMGGSTSTREQGIRRTSQQVSDYNDSFSDMRSTVARYDELPEESYEAELVLDSNGGLSDEESMLAEEWIKTVTNPTPQPRLGDAIENTSAGAAYERSRKLLASQIDPAQATLARLKSDRDMTVPLAQEIQNKWAAIDPDKAIATQDGMVSPLTVLRTEVAYRYASKEWTDRLVDLQPSGKMTELLQMKAIEMHMDWERYQLERARTAMMALNLSRDARDSARDTINRERQVATGQRSPSGNGS